MANLRQILQDDLNGKLSAEGSKQFREDLLKGLWDSAATQEGLTAQVEKIKNSQGLKTVETPEFLQKAGEKIATATQEGAATPTAQTAEKAQIAAGGTLTTPIESAPQEEAEPGIIAKTLSGFAPVSIAEKGTTGFKEGVEAAQEDVQATKEAQAAGEISTPVAFAEQIGNAFNTLLSPTTGAIEEALIEPAVGAAVKGGKASIDLARQIPGNEQFLMLKPEAKEMLATVIGELKDKYDALDDNTKRQLGIAGKSVNNLFTLLGAFEAPKIAMTTSALVEKGLGKGAELINWGGKKIKGSGIKTAEAVLPTTTKEAELMQAFEAGVGPKPRTLGATAAERGVYGTQKGIGTKAVKTGSDIFEKEVNPALKASKEVITKDELFAPIEKRIANTVEPGRKRDLEDAYDAIKEEYAAVEVFDLETAQLIKQGLDEFTPQKAFKGKEIASAYNQLRADMANGIRQSTYNKLSDIAIKNKYLDYANLKELAKVGVKARVQKGIAFKPGGTQTLLRDLWDMAAIPTGSSAGRFLYKVGKFFEFESPVEVKTIGEYLQNMGLTKEDFLSNLVLIPAATTSQAQKDQTQKTQ